MEMGLRLMAMRPLKVVREEVVEVIMLEMSSSSLAGTVNGISVIFHCQGNS